MNMGKKNGVAAKLKTSLDYIIAVHCIAHRLELGVSKSLQDHHRLKHLNDVLVYLYEQYHYSPKALCELRMLGEALRWRQLGVPASKDITVTIPPTPCSLGRCA